MDKAKILYWLEIVGEVFILIARGLTKDKAVGIPQIHEKYHACIVLYVFPNSKTPIYERILPKNVRKSGVSV